MLARPTDRREPLACLHTDFGRPMTDTDAGNGALPDAEGPGIRILAQFIRDLSFENPRVPESLRGGAVQPQIDLGIEMNARAREDGPVFVVELLYGGVFQIAGVEQADLEPVLLIECPRYLFPFARKIIADVTSEGGYPPFLLDPIDFAGVYASRKAEAAGQVVGNA